MPTNLTNGKQNSLTKAINGQKLRNFGGMRELEQTLFMIFKLIGIKESNFPSGPETSIVLNAIFKNYNQYTLEEIYLAFELAITRETLPFMGKGANIEHYQHFDFQYFCKIMFGYRRYKEHQLKPILAKQNKLKEEKEITDFDFLKLNFVNKFNIYVNGGYPWNYGLDLLIFDKFVHYGKIKVPDDIKKVKSNQVRDSLNQNDFENFEAMRKEWSKRVRLHFFNEFINGLRKNKTNLDELIKGI